MWELHGRLEKSGGAQSGFVALPVSEARSHFCLSFLRVWWDLSVPSLGIRGKRGREEGTRLLPSPPKLVRGVWPGRGMSGWGGVGALGPQRGHFQVYPNSRGQETPKTVFL